MGPSSHTSQKQATQKQAMSQWPHTAIVGSVKDHRECSTLVHVTNVDNALAIVKRGSILPYPERELGNALHCKPIEVVWLSPLDYGDSVFGCVAFHFDWGVIQENYGDYIYGLQEVEGRGKDRQSTWKSRILFSHTRLRDHFGECYDPADDGIPWKVWKGTSYIKCDCDCQIGVTDRLSLRHLHHIRFVNHKQMGGGGRDLVTYYRRAEQTFLCRAVSDNLPRIKGFCDVDSSTKLVSTELLKCWEGIWSDIWHHERFKCDGSIKVGNEVAETLARAFLDRYGRAQEREDRSVDFAADAKNIASLFRSTEDLILSLRRVIAAWAGVQRKSLDSPEDWPPKTRCASLTGKQ